MEYGAIDLHKKESQIRIVTADDQVIDHRIATTRERFTQVFWGRPRMRILVEASTESEWVAQHLEQMGHDTGVRGIIKTLMTEAEQVAGRLGVKFPMDLDKRIDGGTAVGAHKTSMLQDFELGRPLELDALVAAVAEIGRLVGVPTPTLDAVLALVRLKVALR